MRRNNGVEKQNNKSNDDFPVGTWVMRRSRDPFISVMADEYRRHGLELERRIIELDSKCCSLIAEKRGTEMLLLFIFTQWPFCVSLLTYVGFGLWAN